MTNVEWRFRPHFAIRYSSFVILSVLIRVHPRLSVVKNGIAQAHRNRPARPARACGSHRARLEEHHEPRAGSGRAFRGRKDFAGRPLERGHADNGRSAPETWVS